MSPLLHVRMGILACLAGAIPVVSAESCIWNVYANGERRSPAGSLGRRCLRGVGCPLQFSHRFRSKVIRLITGEEDGSYLLSKRCEPLADCGRIYGVILPVLSAC